MSKMLTGILVAATLISASLYDKVGPKNSTVVAPAQVQHINAQQTDDEAFAGGGGKVAAARGDPGPAVRKAGSTLQASATVPSM